MVDNREQHFKLGSLRPQTRPQTPPRIFQNSATAHKSPRRGRPREAALKRDLRAAGEVESEGRARAERGGGGGAGLASGVLHHRSKGQSEAPGLEAHGATSLQHMATCAAVD